MSAQELPDFDHPDLARIIEALDRRVVDSLPFGATLINEAGMVEYYSQAESRLSGRGDRATVGLGFFTDIAPCFDNPDFLGRIERARKNGEIDIEFGYVGDFDDADKEVRIRVQSASNGGFWIFNLR